MPEKVYRVVVECHINVKASSEKGARANAEVDARYAMEYARYTNAETRIVDHACYGRMSFLAKSAKPAIDQCSPPNEPVVNE